MDITTKRKNRSQYTPDLVPTQIVGGLLVEKFYGLFRVSPLLILRCDLRMGSFLSFGLP